MAKLDNIEIRNYFFAFVLPEKKLSPLYLGGFDFWTVNARKDTAKWQSMTNSEFSDAWYHYVLSL